MSFPFSACLTVFAFSSGIFTASLIYYLIKIIQKKNFSSSKTTLSLVSLSFIIATVVLYLVGISQKNIVSTFTNFKLGDIIFTVSVFAIGVLFFCFTAMTFFIGFGCYVVFSLFSIIVLTTVYTNKNEFEITINSKEECQTVQVVCHEINPMILIPCKRFWYEQPKKNTDKVESLELNPVFNFMTRLLFSETKTLSAKIPPAEFYPVVDQILIKNAEINVFVKVDKLI